MRSTLWAIAIRPRLEVCLEDRLQYELERTLDHTVADIVPDADDEVRGAVQLVFTLFRETGSAYAVVRRFAHSGLRFPRRAYGGAWAGKLIWGRLTHSRVLGLLKNPSYAGTYVFGRYQYIKSITADGEVRKNTRAVPTPDWRVHLPDHHEGYITVEEFEQNQQRLARNRIVPADRGATSLPGFDVV
ncbi:recombinase family protein [Paraburkholderia sp. JHI2823]|uniref:recombinase family protein n=1 Tax=Paraburkholderia sp. JHI2823 TaxID=3112960 RepID=UPI00316AFF38